MDISDQTRMGGGAGEFDRTPWTEIGRLQSAGIPDRRDLIGDLLSKYWKPVYCYLRHKRYSNEQAKDLTQGFFHEVVIGRKLIQQADKAKGHFRTFLLFALEQFLKSQYRRQNAKKRISPENLVSLKHIDPAQFPQHFDGLSKTDYFNYAWISAMLDRILTELEAQCLANQMDVHWRVFSERVVQPIMENTESPSLERICGRYNIENNQQASNMIVSVKRRFQTILRQYLRESVSSDEDTNDELREIMEFFAKNCAR